MKTSGAKKQTFILTGVNAIVRALGLLLKVWMSRLLGAEAMGIIELSQSVHMVAIAPLTSGVPAAVTRLAAKSKHPETVLFSGMQLVNVFPWFWCRAFLSFRPLSAVFWGICAYCHLFGSALPAS